MRKGKQSARVLRGTVAYTAAAVLQRTVLFLLLPFFTRVLSPAEFGQVGILTTLTSALSVVLGLGLETALFRGYLSNAADQRATNRFVNTVGLFAVIAPLLLSASAMVLAPWVSAELEVPAAAYQLACIGAGATAATTIVPMALLRAQERLGDYLRLTGTQVAITPLLTVVLVAVFDWGSVGWMLAYVLSSVVMLVRGLIILGRRWSRDFDSRQLWAALAFGLPLIPHALAHWGLAVSDRVILGLFVASGQVGTYYAAYLFSLPTSLIAVALSQATQPSYAEASVSGVFGLQRLVTVQTVATVAAAIAVSLVGPPLCLVFLPSSYADAAQLIPWLAAGTCLFGLYLVPVAAVNLIVGRTQLLWVVTVIAAAANVGLNLIFVPLAGTTAAAVNTTIGYGLLFVGVFLYMRRVCNPPLPYDIVRIAAGVLIVSLPAIIVAVLTDPASMATLVVRTLVLAGSGVALVVGPFRSEARATLLAIRPPKPPSLA